MKTTGVESASSPCTLYNEHRDKARTLYVHNCTRLDDIQPTYDMTRVTWNQSNYFACLVYHNRSRTSSYAITFGIQCFVYSELFDKFAHNLLSNFSWVDKLFRLICSVNPLNLQVQAYRKFVLYVSVWCLYFVSLFNDLSWSLLGEFSVVNNHCFYQFVKIKLQRE